MNISLVYWRFSNAIEYFIFEVRHVEITEDQAQDRAHRYPICLNINITKILANDINEINILQETFQKNSVLNFTHELNKKK